MHLVENVALISINATLLVQLVSFLVFMVIFNRILIRPLRKVMIEREAYVVKARQEIEAIDQAYEDILHRIRSQESQARAAALEIREEIEAAGQLSARQILSKTRQEMSELRLAAQKETENQLAIARSSLAAEADTLANSMITSLLDSRSRP